MARRVRLCGKAEIAPGGMRRLDLEGLPPLAAYNVDGTFYCTSNVCTHNVAILTDGFLEGDVIECAMHGGCFNVRTGQAIHFPCSVPLKTYPVTAMGEDLYADVD